ncbi:MAG: hypothetical protein QOG86_1007, partial [Thermoleophilaceae bacterium]|nr:hypothetical protein [Thermoleophilaceae bacterium]
AECGAALTEEEIKASLDAGEVYLCSVHAAERVPLADEDQLEEGYESLRSSSATHSMCGVCGNMSTGLTALSR